MTSAWPPEMAESESSPVALPAGLEHSRDTPVFTEQTVPAALLGEHNTKPGTWGLIHVEEGRLLYRVTDPRRQVPDRVLMPGDLPGIVEPTILHCVEPLGPVRFHVSFWREA